MKNAGYSIVEIVISLLMLAIGMVGVGSLIPTAAQLQRNTYTDMLSNQASETIASTIQSNRFSKLDMQSLDIDLSNPQLPSDAIFEFVRPMPNKVTNPNGGDLVFRPWPRIDRAYPLPTPSDPLAEDAKMYWVPMVQPSIVPTQGWKTYVFVVSRQQTSSSDDRSEAANPLDPDYIPAIRKIDVIQVVKPAAIDSIGNQLGLDLGIQNESFGSSIMLKQIQKADRIFGVGDLVLGNRGDIGRVIKMENSIDGNNKVITVDPPMRESTTEIWYAERTANRPTIRNIMMLPDVID